MYYSLLDLNSCCKIQMMNRLLKIKFNTKIQVEIIQIQIIENNKCLIYLVVDLCVLYLCFLAIFLFRHPFPLVYFPETLNEFASHLLYVVQNELLPYNLAYRV